MRFSFVKVIDWYIVRELISPFFLAVCGFVLFMVANIIFLLVDQIITNKVPIVIVMEILILRLPAIFVLTFPVAMLFASLLGIGRFAADCELNAMRTSGIKFSRILLPVLIVAFVLSVITFITNEKIAPWATHKSETLIRRMLMRQALPMVEPNVFIRGPENKVFYVGQVDKENSKLNRVMVFEMAEGYYPRIIIASEATYDSLNWFLQNGSIHYYEPNGLSTYEVAFKELSIPVSVDAGQFLSGQKTPFEMNLQELQQQIALFSKSGIDVKEMKMDYYFKWSLPIVCFVTTLIGAPMAVRFPRSGRFTGIAVCIVILFVYYALLSIGRALGKNGVLNPFVAAWLPNFLIGGLGLWLVKREDTA